jgi:hypothetical protein
MTIINNVDTERFSFNGVEYFKNFTPVVVGNKIRILNTYDSSIELTSFPTLFSDFEVDGNTYLNVSDLQSDLLPILYSRLSLGDISNKLDKSSTPDSIYATDGSGNQEMIEKADLIVRGDNLTGFEILLSNTSGIIYNKTTPISSDLEIDLTGVVIGGNAKVFHKSSAVPKINGIETIFLSGEYLLNETNVINIFYLGDNKISVNIESATQLYTPLNFSYTAVSDTIVLTWDNMNTNYVLERSTTETFATKTTIYTGGLNTYTDIVGFGKFYYYRIKSVKDNFIDSVFVQLYATNLYTNLLTFVAGPKLLLTEPTANIYSTSSVVNYESYANSDFKIPANTYAWFEYETPNSATEGTIIGLATSNVAGNFSSTKFAVQTGVGSLVIAKFQNGTYVAPDIANGYFAGTNCKLRIVREENGTCKVFKTNDLLTYTLVYTFTETYTGEMWIIINPRNATNLITRPFGYNLMLK